MQVRNRRAHWTVAGLAVALAVTGCAASTDMRVAINTPSSASPSKENVDGVCQVRSAITAEIVANADNASHGALAR